MILIRRMDSQVTEDQLDTFVIISRPRINWFKFKWMQLKEYAERLSKSLFK